MMAIVRLALKRPYTVAISCLLVLLLGVVQIMRMPVDIFPDIDVPVVAVIWQYGGVNADEMAKRFVTVSERAFTTTVNDIEHMESTSLNGVSIIKLYFQPGAKVEAAVAQLTSISQTIVKIMPPGATPPLIIRFSASSVPILQLAVGSKTLSEQALFDIGLNFIRTQLATVQGASLPLPYGGKARQIMVDLDPQALQADGLSATDVTNAITTQNLILPAGSAKIGDREYAVRLNSSPEVLDQLADLPVKAVNGTVIRIGDVAHVRDGYAVQQAIVRQDGRRSTLLTVLKNGGASTLSVVERIKQRLPQVLATLPPSLDVKVLFDQSIFVRASIAGVVREAVIAGLLTAAMILLFLGSWRSTLVVAVSIPLSILCSILGLGALGQTLNVMTLGGLALAVGILVDDATVTLENIHRNKAMGKGLAHAILDGSQQIVSPALVSTLSICIVFVPVFGLSGSARSLFAPMAESVIFAMLASFLLSRTLVPVMVRYLLPAEMEHADEDHGAATAGLFGAVHGAFMAGFNAFSAAYNNALAWALEHRGLVVAAFGLLVVLTSGLVPMLGEDFFPRVDAGEFRLHVRAPTGTRLEETEVVFAQVESAIREIVPSQDLALVLDNIGLGNGLSLAFSDSVTQGASDGEILVSLKEGHAPTAGYVKRLRNELPKRFPRDQFFFQPADIVTQILNFGLPAPIDVQVVGRDQDATYPIARQIEAAMKPIPGAVDVHLHQIVDAPELKVSVDRLKAAEIGLTQRDVANNVITALSSSSQTGPSYWLNPKNGVNYIVAVQQPQNTLGSIPDLMNLPLANGTRAPQVLGNLASVSRGTNVAAVSHYNVQPTFDIFANVQDRDLGGVAGDVERVLAPIRARLPKGTQIAVRGQVESMNTSFTGLGLGLCFAVVLVYALMVVNFQSWLDPFIIMMALPGGLAGIIWMLFATQTTVSVPALMGAIMSVGVATANSILVVSFANDQRKVGMDAVQAALSAGVTRLRPVLMTSLAMIIGMLPMALGLGEGAEQNAPLGRAVVGGLLFATVGTLFLVPVIYSLLRRRAPQDPAMEALEPPSEDRVVLAAAPGGNF